MKIEKNNALFTKQASLWFRGIGAVMVILSHFAEWWSWFYVEEGLLESIRYGISRLGPYGVAVFLLFSGYGLAKTAGDKRIGYLFVVKRVLGVYVPYLILVTIINLLSGGLKTPKDILDLLCGDGFWYMTVMFGFYIAFMVIWFLFANVHIRALLVVGFTTGYSFFLYKEGKYDFWYISNFAFAIGALLALYEWYVKKVVEKIGVIFALLCLMGTLFTVRNALYVEDAGMSPMDEVWSRITAIIIFTMLVVFVAAIWKWYDPVLQLLGKYSLYLYLTHTFLFMWTINFFKFEIWVNFLLALGIIFTSSIVLGKIISLLPDFILKKISKSDANLNEKY